MVTAPNPLTPIATARPNPFPYGAPTPTPASHLASPPNAAQPRLAPASVAATQQGWAFAPNNPNGPRSLNRTLLQEEAANRLYAHPDGLGPNPYNISIGLAATEKLRRIVAPIASVLLIGVPYSVASQSIRMNSWLRVGIGLPLVLLGDWGLSTAMKAVALASLNAKDEVSRFALMQPKAFLNTPIWDVPEAARGQTPAAQPVLQQQSQPPQSEPTPSA
jgi:hypothetical protein